MNKKVILLLVAAAVIIGILILKPFQKNLSSTSNVAELKASEITPSKTLKTYTDPSGFSFSYPDNLSLLNNELKDEGSYAELQLTASGVAGSLVLKIADSKLTSIDEWVKSNKNTYPDPDLIGAEAPKEAKLGNLKTLELKNNDKLLLGALDQGILFTIEIPIGEKKDFWMEVLNTVAGEFTFAPPAADGAATGNSSSTDVTFDGEEVVE